MLMVSVLFQRAVCEEHARSETTIRRERTAKKKREKKRVETGLIHVRAQRAMRGGEERRLERERDRKREREREMYRGN